jgi:hypothetical protein
MKKFIGYLFSILFILFFFITGCLKKENFSEIPAIQFVGFTEVFDTGLYAVRGIITISFQDGNGDIGLNAGDTLPPYDKAGKYYYNFVVTYLEKRNGTYDTVLLDPPFSARIPVLTPDDPNKAIKGVINDTVVLNPKPVYDTVRFTVMIYDRALHPSNIVSTPEIILKKH